MAHGVVVTICKNKEFITLIGKTDNAQHCHHNLLTCNTIIQLLLLTLSLAI